MNYIAQKPCKFSRQYSIGEIIPGEEVSPGASPFLEKWGIIVPYDGEVPSHKQDEAELGGEGAGDGDEGKDSGLDPKGAELSVGGTEGRLDEKQLAQMKKEDLLKLAADMKVDVSTAKDKAEIAVLLASVPVMAIEPAPEAAQ